MTTPRAALVAVIATLSLGLTACGSGGDAGDPAPDASSSTGTSTVTGTSTLPSSTTPTSDDPDVARVRAAEASAGGRAHEVEVDDGTWTVHVATDEGSTEVTLAQDGTATAGDTVALDADVRATLKEAQVDLGEAIEIANEGSGSPFVGAQIGERKGEPQWHVAYAPDPDTPVDKRTRVTVDIVSGDVVIVLPTTPFTLPPPPG